MDQAMQSKLGDVDLTVDAALRGLHAVMSGDVPLDQVAQVHANLVRAAQQVAVLSDPQSGRLLVAPRGGFDAL